MSADRAVKRVRDRIMSLPSTESLPYRRPSFKSRTQDGPFLAMFFARIPGIIVLDSSVPCPKDKDSGDQI